MLLIRNDLFRFRIQLWISKFQIQARVPDPSGSNPCYLSIFGNYKYFILQSYSAHSPKFSGLKWEIPYSFNLSALSFFAGSRHKFRIRIGNTDNYYKFYLMVMVIFFYMLVLPGTVGWCHVATTWSRWWPAWTAMTRPTWSSATCRRAG